MSDTVYDKNGIHFTRFWVGSKKDCVQITLISEDAQRCLGYRTMTFLEFQEAFEAIKNSVEETKDAWWHTLCKGG